MGTMHAGHAGMPGMADRLHLLASRTYRCRECRATRRASDPYFLPDHCEACGAGTWEDDGRCGNWLECDGERRPGGRGRASCACCGYSVWVAVRTPRSPVRP